MSYLHLPRLLFSGDFKSDVSTVNNDPAHYNNATFQPSFQEPGEGSTNGWWNPEGGATFTFLNCEVKQVVMPGDQVLTHPTEDPIIGQQVLGAEGRNTGKMVDLDPQEQGSSELWGTTLRILNAQGDLLLSGKLRTTGFRDLQVRQQAGASVNGQPCGGTWTTVLEEVTWGANAFRSPYLYLLQSITQMNRLSLNLNAYGYYYAHAADGRFSLGRILGSIGPWFQDEPETFILGRRLYGVYQTMVGDKAGIIPFSNTNFLFDKNKRRLSIDLGGSFPINDALGTIVGSFTYVIGVSNVPLTQPISRHAVEVRSQDVEIIGKVPYQAGRDWLQDTGGIVTWSSLTDQQLSLLEGRQVVLLQEDNSNRRYLIARESIDGLVVRADNFVNRLDAGEVAQVRFYAARYGRPLANAGINVSLQPPTKPEDGPICVIPGNNYPQDGIAFPPTVRTDGKGSASLRIKGNAIRRPRGYIDGQIYTLDYQLAGANTDPAIGDMSNDNVFIHLRDDFPLLQNPTWQDIAPIMIQFGNLYPIMSKYLVDFKNPYSLIEKRDLLKFAFSCDITDPVYMPVTRDLSANKMAAILKWLDNPVIRAEEASGDEHAETQVTEAVEPAAIEDAPESLTPAQQRLKNAVRAKNGSQLNFTDITTLFDF